MEFTKMFRHPKYYKELRKRNKETQQELQRILDKPGRSVSNSDQVISGASATAPVQRAPGPGLKQQAIDETVPHCDIEEATSSQAASDKLQAPSRKHQASSRKRQAHES